MILIIGFRTFEFMMKIIFTSSFVFFFTILNAQLITDSEGNSNLSFNNNNVLYVGVDGINSFRELSPNTNFLSTPLGERENEISRWMSGYSLRMAIPAFRFFKINTGLAILQSGESYDWNSAVTDSSYAYQRTFRHIGLPVQLAFEYGNKLSIYGAFGVTPAIFNAFRQQIQWKNALGSEDSDELSIQDDCNSFIISLQANFGIHYHFNDTFGLQLTALYRKQLSNTYKEFEDYIHKAYAFGFNFALSYQF